MAYSLLSGSRRLGFRSRVSSKLGVSLGSYSAFVNFEFLIIKMGVLTLG